MPLYEFAPSFTVDQGDLTLTASGSGVHLNKSVTINLGILDRTSGSIEGNADLLANAYVDNVSVDILNNLGAVEYEDFLTDYKSNVFTFTEYDNINVFGEYTKDFGIRVTVSESSQTHTSEFYFYGNHPEFSGITVQDSTGTTSHSSSQSSKTAVNASGQTGVLTSTITFNNDIAYTNFDRLEIYSSTGSSAFADQVNPNPVFSRNLTNQSIQSFDINEGELPNGEPVYLHYVPYGNLGTGAVWTVGPYTFEDNPIATNQYITKDDTGDFGGNQDLSGVLTNGNSAELGFIVGASEITGDLTVGGDIITDSATTIGACGEVLNLKGDFVTLQYCPGISSAETPQTFLQISSSEQVEFYRQGNFTSGLYVNHSQSIEFGGKSKIFTDNQSGVSSLNLESDKIIFNISGSSDEQIDLRNIVGSFGSAILLGTKNRIFGDYDGIVAGTENVISGDSTYSSDFSFIGAGSGNEITGSDYASIVGGIGNNILKTSDNSFIGGGTGNVLEGSRNSVIGGGVNNYINSSESVQIFGSYVNDSAGHNGYVYLADNNNRTKNPNASDTLFIDFEGGVDIKTGDLTVVENITMGGDTVATQDWVTGQGYITSETDDQTLDEVLTQGNVSASGITVGSSTISGDLDVSGALAVTNDDTGVSDIFSVDGVNGRLFGVTDEVTGTVFSVNDAAGLPIVEVESTSGYDKITIGEYGSDALVISGTNSALFNVDVDITGGLDVTGDITMGGATVLTGISSSDVTDALGYTPLESESQTLSSVLANGNTSSYGISVNQITGTTLTIDTDTLFVDATNNRVGIRTTSPGSDYALDVNGTVRAGGLIVDTNTLYVDTVNDRVGIGVSNPDEALHVAGNLELGSNFQIGSNGGNYRQRIRTVDSSPSTTNAFNFETRNGAGTDFVTHLTIRNDGNVGIGTTSPSYELDVSGSGHFLNDLIVDEDITMGGNIVLTGITSGDITGALGYTPLSSETDDQTLDEVLTQGNTSSQNISVGAITGSALTIDTDTLFVDATNNRVGIGTTSVGHPLVVQGASAYSDTNIQLTDSSSDERLKFGYNSDGAYIYGGDNGIGTSVLRLRATNNSPIRIGAHNGSVFLEPGPYDGTNKYEFRAGEIHSYIRKSDGNQQKASVIHHDVYDETNNYTSISLATLAGNTESVGLLVKRYSDGNRVGIRTTNPDAALHVDDGNAIIGRVGSGSPNSTLTVAGYDDFGLDFKAHNTWTHWKARVGHGRNFELYNDGANNDNQTLQLGKTNATENASLLLFSTGVFMDVGRNPNYPLARFSVDADNSLAGDLYVDIRSSTTVTDRFEFNRGGEFIASGIGVGYTSPSYELDVSGSGHFLNDLIVDEDITMGGNVVLTGITSGDITGALGYTPLSSETDDQTLDEVLAQGNTSSYGIHVNQISGTSLDITTDVTVTGDVEADEFIGDLRGAVSFRAKAGEALSAGDVVYISGIDGNTTVVAKADADDSNKMPAFGVSKETVSANANVRVVNFGSIGNLDTSAYSEGDELFVSDVAGLLTGIAPTGESSALQKMAKVTRSHGSSGSITVMGAGRTNAVPNLNEGRLFVGNSSNEAVADGTIHVDIANSKVGIGTTSPSATLTVIGSANDSTFRLNSFSGSGYIDALMGNTPYFRLYQSNGNRLQIGPGDGNINRYDNANSAIDLSFATNGGNVGIGTTSPASILDVNGSITLGNDTEHQLTKITTSNITSDTIDVTEIKGRQIDLYAFDDIWLRAGTTDDIGFVAGGATRMFIESAGNIGIGTTSPDYELHVIGTASFTDTVAGAYFEENASHESLKSMRTGFILVMDEDGELVPCTKENDTTVFGVAKKGYKQPIIMGAEPIKVTGPIKVGDFITTSNVEGHGMKAENPQFGTIIAQAMESGDGESYNIKAMIRKM